VPASCHTCGGWRDVDLAALAAVKGEDFDLWGKRTTCRIIAGCPGKIRLQFYARGRFEPIRESNVRFPPMSVVQPQTEWPC